MVDKSNSSSNSNINSHNNREPAVPPSTLASAAATSNGRSLLNLTGQLANAWSSLSLSPFASTSNTTSNTSSSALLIAPTTDTANSRHFNSPNGASSGSGKAYSNINSVITLSTVEGLNLGDTEVEVEDDEEGTDCTSPLISPDQQTKGSNNGSSNSSVSGYSSVLSPVTRT
jgi:hypothetical protein